MKAGMAVMMTGSFRESKNIQPTSVSASCLQQNQETHKKTQADTTLQRDKTFQLEPVSSALCLVRDKIWVLLNSLNIPDRAPTKQNQTTTH